MTSDSSTSELVINCYFHFQILFLFLSILFILVISKMSKKALRHEINKTIKNNLAPIIKSQPEIVKQQLRLLPLNNLKQIYKQEQPYVQLNNKVLFKTIIMLNVLFLVSIVIIIAILKYNCNLSVDIKNLLINNGIVFFFVGIVEYLFFKMVASKVVPTPPSHLATVTKDDLQQVLQNNKSHSIDDNSNLQLQKLLLLLNLSSQTNNGTLPTNLSSLQSIMTSLPSNMQVFPDIKDPSNIQVPSNLQVSSNTPLPYNTSYSYSS